MKGEINKDWYCSNYYCTCDKQEDCLEHGCFNCHRKYPTPEQFKEEYGEDYPNSGAVYVYDTSMWMILSYSNSHGYKHNDAMHPVICACTPWGKPPNDWRPE